ncbi:hypothetical protein GEV33_004828 [Tenebrio molitor]|uniref:MADF domain-containing protein n=1 Tax=Tenebrio molitor TaxID=7067 RepID=A0A8J6HPH9_TENMO|nr:hypothetical protein GEV33_004828 [Tenebrio molitor]
MLEILVALVQKQGEIEVSYPSLFLVSDSQTTEVNRTPNQQKSKMSLSTCRIQLKKNTTNLWSAEELDILINAVRAHEELYNQSNASYSNREIIDQIWHRVASQLNKTKCSKTHRDGNVYGLPPKNLHIEGGKAINRGNQRQKGKFTAIRGVGRRDDVVEFTRAVGDDSSKYHRPNRQADQGLHYGRFQTERFCGSGSRRVLPVHVVPGLTGRCRIYPPARPEQWVKLFIYGFTVSDGSDLVSIVLSASTTISCDVNPELAEGKGEEFGVLTLNGGRCNHFSVRKRVGLPPAHIFAICCQRCRRIRSLARWPHGCRRQCSEVAVPALVGSNPTEGGGFFQGRNLRRAMDVCICLAGADGRVVEGRPTLFRHHREVSRKKEKEKRGWAWVAGESTPEPRRTT